MGLGRKTRERKCPSHHVPLGPCSQHDSSPFALDHLAEVCLSGVTSEEFLFLSPPSHPVLSGERTHTCGPHLRSGVHRFDIPLSGSVFSPSLRGQYRHKRLVFPPPLNFLQLSTYIRIDLRTFILYFGLQSKTTFFILLLKAFQVCLDIPHQWGLGFVFSTSSLQALQDIPGSSCAFLPSLRARCFPRSPGSCYWRRCKRPRSGLFWWSSG